MKPFNELEVRYRTDAPFNKMVNLFRQLIEEYGFVPSEIREGLFMATYMYEMSNPQMIIRTQKDLENIALARKLMQDTFAMAPQPTNIYSTEEKD